MLERGFTLVKLLWTDRIFIALRAKNHIDTFLPVNLRYGFHTELLHHLT